METQHIQRAFRRMGAEIAIGDAAAALKRSRARRGAWGRQPMPFELDIARRDKTEVFTLTVQPKTKVDVHVADVRPDLRHLLLMVREELGSGSTRLSRFLCGHDERSWFVAASPGGSNVQQAMEALKPAMVRTAQGQKAVPQRYRNRRRNEAFVRQGEWFFLPAPNLDVPPDRVLRNEPLQRAGGKPHVAEFAYRIGGQRVFVCTRYLDGVSEREYRELLARERGAKRWGWREMVREPRVFVRGRIRHSDHKTVVLSGWHRVLPNTETQTAARANLAFLD